MTEPDTSPIIQIVDENDQPTGEATIVQARNNQLWHRIIRVVIRDEDGNVLLQKRGPANKILPGAWDASASGHVDPGEDYLTAAAREAQEEIGLQDAGLEEIDYYQGTEIYGPFELQRFNKTFTVQLPRDYQFDLEPEEVSEVKWFTVAELKDLVASQPDNVTPGLKRIAENL